MHQHESTLERLDNQVALYERKSEISRRRLRWLKGIQIAAAGAIAAAAKVEAPRAVDPALAVLIIVTQGVQHFARYEQKWSSYRRTCEALKQEKWLFLEQARPYTHNSDARRLLAQRIEELISTDVTQWISKHEPTSEAA